MSPSPFSTPGFRRPSTAAVRILFFLTFAVAVLLVIPLIATASSLSVNDIGDAPDFNPGDGVCETAAGNGVCTLRAAIEEANSTTESDTITFSLPGPGPHTISPASALPSIIHPVTIDGYTQAGASENTVPLGAANNAILMVELDGTNAGSTSGLHIEGDGGTTIRGLVIRDFSGHAIVMGNFGVTSEAPGNVVAGNYIGTDQTGLLDRGNRSGGITMVGSPDNIIGGAAPAAHNVIAANHGEGVGIYGSATTGNVIEGNYIGVDASGGSALGNWEQGVIISAATGNTIGGLDAGAGNVISGNGLAINQLDGVYINEDGGYNVVQGNLVGTDATGSVPIANAGGGIQVASDYNLIGGGTPAARNVVSGNTGVGVAIGLLGARSHNTIQGNYIGTDASGLVAIANGAEGVRLTSGHNQVGGTSPGAANVISGNAGNGIVLSGSNAIDQSGNIVQGNLIGTDADGSFALPNGGDGVVIEMQDNTIGGTDAGAGNTISANTGVGIRIGSSSSSFDVSGNVLQGNRIGTDIGGTLALGNGAGGVQLNGVVSSATVGGTSSSAGNVISGNAGIGLEIDTAGAYVVQGNLIGTDVTGTAALGNGSYGVVLTPPSFSWDGISSTLIGGTTSGARNVISANGAAGMFIGAGAGTVLVQGNVIGTDPAGSADLGNTADGVYVESDAYLSLSFGDARKEIGGTAPGAGNVIAHNGGDGITIGPVLGLLGGSATSSRVISHNSIYSNGGLGIDLKADGITPNDATEADELQNFPILTSAEYGSTKVAGTFSSYPDAAFTLEFFASSACDPSNFGEGETFLGADIVGTDVNGAAIFDFTFPATVLPGQYVTATATRTAPAVTTAGNSTSEFSECKKVPPSLTVTKIVVNDNGGTATAPDFNLYVDCGSGPEAITSGVGRSISPSPADCSVSEDDPGIAYVGTIGGDCDPTGAIRVNDGDIVACTITNDDVAPTITVTTEVTNDNGGTAGVVDFPLEVDCGFGPIAVTSGVTADVAAGDCAVSEGGSGGYVATFGGDCDASGVVTLGLGETASCTITNDDIAPTLTLAKIVVNDNGGSAATTDFHLDAAGPTPFGGDGGATSDGSFSAGAYTLSESGGPAGYAPGAWNCTGDGSLVGDELTLGLGETASCTITNDDIAPTLTLAKIVVNDNGGSAATTDFHLDAAGPTPFGGDGGATSDGSFSAGAYTLSESGGPAGYAPGAWNCTGDGSLVGDELTLGLGETASCTITNDDITVIPVNDPPVAADDTYTTDEDTVLSVAVAGGLLVNDSDLDADPLSAALVTGVTHGVLALNADGSFDYTPAAGYNGSDTFTYTACDPAPLCDTATVTITVIPVNDAPSFSAGADDTVLEDAGPQTVAGWATGISAGPADEAGQVLGFSVTTDNDSLFSVLPAIDPATGDLTYTPAAEANGTATLTIALIDDGGTANGGLDTSPDQFAVITVIPVNDAPSFSAGADDTVLEDAGPQTVAGWATGISAGPADEAGQVLGFSVTTDNDSLFSVLPAIDPATGDLTYTPAAEANGTATLTIALIDDGGTANGGLDTSPDQFAVITVIPVNDPPVAADDTYTTDEDTVLSVAVAGGLLVNDSDLDADPLSAALVTGVTHGVLALNADGSFDYTPAAGYNGSDTFTYTACDPAPLCDTATVTITVTPVNGNGDDEGPITSVVEATPNPVAIGTDVLLSALVDDTTTGGSSIASAEYRIDAGTFLPLSATDGGFDAVTEGVSGTIPWASIAQVGIYSVCVRGTDQPGNVGPESCVLLVVYDPSEGFVTGGGWIDSPQGAYLADDTVFGRANFGFVAKYKKGKSVPDGQTEFMFSAAGLSFHSTAYEYLLVNRNSSRAQFKGVGTINGTGEYGFMIWATDGDLNGSEQDTFRIKIWLEHADGTQTVVYDNGSDQVLSGGNVTIHKAR